MFLIFVVYHVQQIKFTCASTAWKKYVYWLNIIPIIFYIIFGPCMNMYEPHWRLPLVLNLRNLYLLQFHHVGDKSTLRDYSYCVISTYFRKKEQGQIHWKEHYIFNLRVPYFLTIKSSVQYSWGSCWAL